MSFFSKLFGRKPAAPAASSSVLDLKAFAERFAGELRDAFPDAHIRIVPGAQNDARIDVSLPGEIQAGLQLGNAYQRYLSAPQELDAVLADQMASVREMQRRLASDDADAGVVLPVIKTREWHEVAMQQLRAAQPEAAQAPFLIEPLAGDLIVTYVVDTPASMSFLSPQEAEERELHGEALRGHALDNLAKLLPELELKGGGGRYAARLDRNYDAGMALLFDRWRERIEVRGEPVFAIAARDELMVCGSEDGESLAELRGIAQEISRSSPYGLSAGLFVWRDGGLRAFEG
ncbi:hypothetical protein J5226_09470 [Lysobacter sp. K5869]|uniref:hypothetical protein n=1 Tax=Lysobacter sp. K5869 TaxID=2820808 RepID=UPI001C06060B|nr:hypothetical protein [Lysobacter sp. K5869]QWP78598.1 hypothetical protein J5226_09470 [Lysobacter sp. K5869]